MSDDATTTPNTVPAALSTLIGRRRELTEAHDRLRGTRLLTLTGAGGAGKTRLARELAAEIANTQPPSYPGGVWWVELAPVAGGAEVPQAVAAVLHVHAGPGRELASAIGDALGARPTLLVLDNCEHVVDAVATLADRLLRAAPALSVLTTSRETLGVEGEVAWVVPPLAHPTTLVDPPSPDTLAGYEAVQLFVERARAAMPSFAITTRNAHAVATVCARLDGLPLALELAAASVGVIGVERLAQELDDALAVLTRGRRTALPQHQTLRALLDWSYALLDDETRMLLRRLSVFRGGFTLDAVAAVCGSGDRPSIDTIVEPLSRLAAQSLVDVREQAGEVRYRLLETVRQYAAALLRDTADDAHTRARHARYVADFVDAAQPALWSAARGRAVERLQHDIDDIRSALAWAAGPDGDALVATRIAAGLTWFWYSGMPWEEARRWIAEVIDAADRAGMGADDAPPSARVLLASTLYPAAGLAYFAGDPDGILVHARRGLALWEQLDAERASGANDVPFEVIARGRTMANEILGHAYQALGQGDAAVRSLDAALQASRDSRDTRLAAIMRMRRALVLLGERRHEEASAEFTAGADELRAVGELWFLSLCLQGLSENALATENLASASDRARESIAVLADEPDRWFISRSLDTLAAIAVASGAVRQHPSDVARLLGAAEGLRRRCGAEVMGVDRDRYVATERAARSALSSPAFADAWHAGTSLDLQGVFELAATARVLPDGAAPSATRSDNWTGEYAMPIARTSETPALRVRALGPMLLLRDGVDIDPADWQVAKVKEMLLYLLLNGPRTKEQIGLALWPDASAAQLRNHFHVTMHRLRRTLGRREWVVFAEGTTAYQLDRSPGPGLVLDSDVDRILASAERLKNHERRGAMPTTDDLRRARAAFALADRGALGEGVATGDWLVEHQDRLRESLSAGLSALAHFHAERDEHAEAADVYRALLARDPFAEGAHRGLMRAYAAAGEPARALQHYGEVAALLRRELGTAPARETTALAERLRDGRPAVVAE
jgi:predicted ATPase/DNA-binding SARP family transcriptional activator